MSLKMSLASEFSGARPGEPKPSRPAKDATCGAEVTGLRLGPHIRTACSGLSFAQAPAMPRRPVRTLIVLSLALAVVTATTGSPRVEAQNQPPSPDVQQSDLAGKLARIERDVEQKRKELGVPGAALAIVKGDKVIFQKGFGLRDVERQLPVTADTLFAIGSSTKSFTAMAAVISQDQGRLSLDDSPKKYLSSFRVQDPEADKTITVRDLLLHRSGLKVSDFVWAPGVLNRNDVIKLFGLAKPTAKLREKFQYQNIGYTAAGEVVARANGTTWERFIGERIFKPLGMTSSHASIRQMAKDRDHATGYSVDDKVATKEDLLDVSAIAPAGAINSNVKDMSQWIRLMLGGGTFEGKRIVSERGFNDIVRKQISVGDNLPFADASYGLGWLASDRNGHPLIFHPGGLPGFNAVVGVVPDQRLGFVVLVNASTPLDEAITDLVLDIMVGKSGSPTVTAGSVPQGEAANNAAAAGPASPATSDITLDALMAQVIAAAGGEANLRRHRSTTMTGTLEFENQGVTGKVVIYAQAPNSATQIMTLTALGKTIASSREYFDGTQAGGELLRGRRSVADQKYEGEQLEFTRVSSNYYEQLNWKTLYASVSIEKSTVAGEETYRVVKTPQKGPAIIDYISTKSFRLVRRRSAGIQDTTYSDYRNVDGEMVAFGFVTVGDDGRIVGRVQEVKFNTSIPPFTFRPAKR
jgi:CubicO group peptidase (beta-lactamase class C family)